ncbi:hypothetical protein A5881_003717 [Enterococcus termitis]|nr:hypothetical protein A5881_000089 [Enterococcus termitis]
MNIEIWQIILLTLLAFIGVVEMLGTNILAGQAVIIGMLAGIIMGDIKTGLAVGATLQLMGLGIQAYGGASVPDYMTASIIGTTFAILSNKGVEFGLSLAIPVGLLMVQLDILARFCNVFFQKRIDKAIAKTDVKKVKLNNRLGVLSWGLSRSLPVFVMLVFGEGLVNLMLNYIPAWLTNGLASAGGLLPAVGIAILLRYLPVKNYITYLIVGFAAVAYLSIPMFGVALIGFGLALKAFKDTIKEQNQKEQQTVVYSANMNGGLHDGEYED